MTTIYSENAFLHNKILCKMTNIRGKNGGYISLESLIDFFMSTLDQLNLTPDELYLSEPEEVGLWLERSIPIK